MLQQVVQPFHLAAAGTGCGTSTGILPSLYDGLCTAGGTTPQVHSVADVAIIIGNLVRILIAISGSLAVILLLVASIYYITAMGDPGRIKRAKDIILYDMVGLVLIIMAYAIITYIVGAF
ncbi:MAG TPA: hypothetical protein VMT30_00595 [Candidatus Saccharimonadia bacterium]|nr:hypothetical protein [Candidatus Saccharimonadia bacterium]